MRDFKGSPDDFAIGGTGGVAGVSWPVFRYIYFPWMSFCLFFSCLVCQVGRNILLLLMI